MMFAEEAELQQGGTLTFLFTDMEGSSRRWEALPDAMSAALTRHDQLLTTAITEAAGTLFKHTGDGVCAVFATASSALVAAVAAQRALLAENWGELRALPVRMALHSGSAEHRHGDWFGPTLNRTSRLLATAHGGQVVVSMACAELAQDDLPAKVDLVDLGEHRLADLSRTERVFQVIHPDLIANFPPLRAPGRHNLPAGLSTFVGREREVAEVAALMKEARLVTITGTGGAGKTRLALAVGAAVAASFPDGVFLTQLAPLTDPELVGPQVEAALGLMGGAPGSPVGDATERIVRHLARRRTLLILDNCEHLLDAVAGLARLALERCPHLVVLATSREALGLEGERAWRIPPLTLPPESGDPEAVAGSEAVALFCERARGADASFRLGADNAAVVGRICRRLDGLPLALELATARLRALSLDQIAQRLDDRFRLLTAGTRTTLPHHRTLRATIDWSWDLLSDDERALLRRLSVFAGGFSLTAAEEVGADGERVRDADVLDLVAGLVDKSLVGVSAAGTEARYDLSETVRQYAAERLAGDRDDLPATRNRHLVHFVAFARQHVTVGAYGGETWFHLLAPEYENLRVALDWALGSDQGLVALRMAGTLANFWRCDGRLEEGRAHLERALAIASEAPPKTRGRVLCGLANLVNDQGEAALAETLAEEARTLAISAGDDHGRSAALASAAAFALQRGDVARARQLATEARAVSEGAVDVWLAYFSGWIALAEGDPSTARAEFEASLRRAAGPTAQLETGSGEAGGGGTDALVHIQAALAPVLARLGDVAQAESLLDAALAGAARLGRNNMAMARVRAAEMWIAAGEPARARDNVADALARLRDLGGRAWVADALELAVIVLAAIGRHGPAIRIAGAAEAVREALGQTGRFRLVHATYTTACADSQHRLGPEAAERQSALGRATAANAALAFASEQLLR